MVRRKNATRVMFGNRGCWEATVRERSVTGVRSSCTWSANAGFGRIGLSFFPPPRFKCFYSRNGSLLLTCREAGRTSRYRGSDLTVTARA